MYGDDRFKEYSYKGMGIYDLILSRNEGIYEGMMIVDYRLISRESLNIDNRKKTEKRGTIEKGWRVSGNAGDHNGKTIRYMII